MKQSPYIVTIQCEVIVSATSPEDAEMRVLHYDGVGKTAQRNGRNWRIVGSRKPERSAE